MWCRHWKNLRTISAHVFCISSPKKQGYPRRERPVGSMRPALIPAWIPAKSAPSPHPTYTEVFGSWLCEMAEQDERLLGITRPCAKGSGLVNVSEQYPSAILMSHSEHTP